MNITKETEHSDVLVPTAKLGCVIMASGLGQRFGGNKLMADFCGQPMIARVLAATDNLFCRRVVVTRSEETAAYCRALGAEVILHTQPHRNDTVRLGLDVMADTDGCLFCPADQPLLSRETVAAITLCAANDPHAIVRPSCDCTVGAPVLFPRRFYDALMSLPEGKGGGYVAKQHPDAVRCVAARHAYELADADTPDAMAQLAAIARERNM